MADNQSFYDQIADALADLPGGFPRTSSKVEMEILARLLPPQDARLVSKLGPDPAPTRAVAARTGLSEDDAWISLVRLGRRGLVHYSSLGESQFGLRTFGDMLHAALRKGDVVLASLIKSYLEELARSGLYPDFYPGLLEAVQAPKGAAGRRIRPISERKETVYPPERDRGGCLSLWLVGVMVTNLLQPFVLGALWGHVNGWMVFLSFLNVVFAAALWNWQKWGAYGLGLSLGLVFLIGMAWGDWEIAAGAAVPLVLLFFLVSPKWNLFD